MEITNFNKVLSIRAVLKRIGQLSWNIKQIDERYPVETIDDDKVKELLTAYTELAKEVSEILSELQHELETAD